MNWNYTKANGDTLNNEKNYIVIAFDSAFDAYTQTGYPQTSYSNIRVDSLFAIVGHENNTGLDDTLITKIVTVDSRGYPTSTILWRDTSISQSFAGGVPWDNFSNLAELSWAPNLLLPTSKRFAVRMEYHGDRADTFGVVYGFGSFNAPCPSQNFDLAVTTNFSTITSGTPPPPSFVANSVMLWTKYTQYGLLPRAADGASIFYDCNSNGTYDAGTDGENYVQNWLIRAVVTTDAPSGIEAEYMKAGIRLYQNTPNPFAHSSTINYELAKPGNVSLAIYDIAQRKIAVLDEGSKSAGKHSITVDSGTLSEGLYFYTLNVGDISFTKKMMIAK